MKNINSIDLLKLFTKTVDNSLTISNFNIEIENSIEIDTSLIDSVEFKNCFFKGDRIDFYDFDRQDIAKDKYSSLSFIDCKIENDLFIKDCYLYNVEFRNVEITSKRFFIAAADIKRITITGSPVKYNSINSLILDNLIYEDTTLDIRLNDFYDVLNISRSMFNDTTINANNINRIVISDTSFNDNFTFWKNKTNSYSFIHDCTFNDMDANDSDFGKEAHFEKTKFLGNCNFENVKGINTGLKFTKCNFDKYVYFDKSTLSEMLFDTAFFKEIVSFQNIHCNIIQLNRTHFDKVAFFTDIQIDSLNKCDLKTIRIIKNQLLKIENKIDYLKYNAVEHNILLNSANLSLNDRILLRLNKQSNDFGNDWIQAVKFTLKKGLLFFVLLLVVNTFIISKYPLSLNYKNDLASFSQILTEFLKFVFSLGFDNKEIQSNGFLYLIFITAKIFIGYGIYQTISAFRKYGKSQI